MPKNDFTIPLISEPGIQRDGTQFNSTSYIDGQWVRFSEKGLPRKIGGTKVVDNGNGTIIRTLFNVPKPNSVDTYIGRNDSVSYVHFNSNVEGDAEVNRTPDDYVFDENNAWMFDIFTNKEAPDDSFIVAHVAPNADDGSNTTEGPIYFGHTVGPERNLPLAQITGESGPVLASGGIIYASPIMVAYGNNGFIRWSEEGDIENWPDANNQTISNVKIINMFRARGNQFPQLLAWTLNSLINLNYDGSGPVSSFNATTIKENITVISPKSIVEHGSEFYWIGDNNFYHYNGVVNVLENTMNKNWFFENLNFSQKSKIFGVSNPLFNEIWWYYPKNGSEENNAVLIYNSHLNVFYDSIHSRSAGVSPGILHYPLFADNEPLEIITRTGRINVYPIWMHEFGYDKVISDQNIASIYSSFEERITTLFERDPAANRLQRSLRIEPDFRQRGTMTVKINNRMFPSDTLANGRLIQSEPYPFDLNTPKIDNINSQGRLVSFLFESNELGEAYEKGKVLLNYDLGDYAP